MGRASTSLQNHLITLKLGAAWASYEGAKETLERFKSLGINYLYMGNYSCEPGVHLGFTEILRAADDMGMLIGFTQPHFSSYDWKAPDADKNNGYARHAEWYVRVAQNHPSVVCYATSHNATGYVEQGNPDRIDGIPNPLENSGGNALLALRAEAIIKRFDTEPGYLPPLLRQPGLDAYDELLCQLRAESGALGLVRALGDKRRETAFPVRIWLPLLVGLDDVSRLVQGQPRMGRRECALGSSAMQNGMHNLLVIRPTRWVSVKRQICGGRRNALRPARYGITGNTLQR